MSGILNRLEKGVVLGAEGYLFELERRGYVLRSPNPNDRRGIIVELTPAGLDAVAQVRTIIHKQEREWMSALSADELATYIDLMHRIQETVAGEG